MKSELLFHIEALTYGYVRRLKMAERPYYFVVEERQTIGKGEVSFEWCPGFSIAQKQRSIHAMHEEIRKRGRNPLEISTKSEVSLGKRLSAFHLKLDGILLENIFQSSKVFEKGGPYLDLLEVSSKEAKRDERLKTSGDLVKFTYKDIDWPLIPRTVFYDWIYYNAVRESVSQEELEELKGYDAFTDIEFYPKRSINTQARAIALVQLIYIINGKLPEMSPEDFLALHKRVVH